MVLTVLKWLASPYVELYNFINRTIAGGIMDPVNRWLTLVACFMIVVVIALFKVGGENRWQMEVMSYSETHDMVYVLDTKTGEIKGKLHDKNEHLALKDGQTYADKDWNTVREEPEDKSRYRYGRKDYSTTPVSKPYYHRNN